MTESVAGNGSQPMASPPDAGSIAERTSQDKILASGTIPQTSSQPTVATAAVGMRTVPMRQGQLFVWNLVCRLTDNGRRSWSGTLIHEPEMRDPALKRHDRYINDLATRLKLVRIARPPGNQGREITLLVDPATILPTLIEDAFSKYAAIPEDRDIDYAAADKAWRQAFRWKRNPFTDATLRRKVEQRPVLKYVQHRTLGGATCFRW